MSQSFPSPKEYEPELLAELRPAMEMAGQLFVDFYEQLDQRRVYPDASHAELEALFRGSLTEQGIGLLAALAEFRNSVLNNSMTTPHPLYLGLVNSSPLPAGPIADLLISMLNNNAGSAHQSPAITGIEQEVIRAFANLCQMPEGTSGMILPGGTFANLQALLLARQKHFPEWLEHGPQAIRHPPKLYQSEVTHFCNDRAISIAGLGRTAIQRISCTGRGAMDATHLKQCIEADLASGAKPFAVIANAGSTGTGAIDDLQSVADICEQFGLWMHVDACYGGAALLLEPEIDSLVKGIGRADSVAVDPHKWFFVPITAGLLLCRHTDVQLEAFDCNTSYIPGDGSIDAYRRGIPTSRRASALAVWLVLRAHGWSAIREAVNRNVSLIRLAETKLRERGFRVLDDGQLSIACARWEPASHSAEQLDQLQQSISQHIIASGQAWFATVAHQGETWLRLNLVNIHTREHHIERLADLLLEAAQTLTVKPMA